MEESWRNLISIVNPQIRAGGSAFFCVDCEETEKIFICGLFLSPRCAKIFGQMWRFYGEFSYSKIMEFLHFFHICFAFHTKNIIRYRSFGSFLVFNILSTIVDNVEIVENFRVEIVENSRPYKELETFLCWKCWKIFGRARGCWKLISRRLVFNIVFNI